MEDDQQAVRLVCLPFAGAAASFYRPWRDHASADLVVTPLQLPGRERLIDVEPYRDLRVAADGLATQLSEGFDGPATVALFGHSLGAVLAYELARRLVARPDVDLLHLYVSGSPAPYRPRTNRATGLGDEEFLSRVREFAGYSHDALDDPEMRDLVLPTLRADVEMHENYVAAQDDEPLAVPVTAIRGQADDLVARDELDGWARTTTKTFEVAELPGGHMYLVDSAAPLLRLIAGTRR